MKTGGVAPPVRVNRSLRQAVLAYFSGSGSSRPPNL